MEEMNKLNDEVLEGVAGGMLSRNQALAKALKREGLNKNQVDYVERVELDYERGRKVYEIKFYRGGLEYDFDVDAQSGAILKYERDYDD